MTLDVAAALAALRARTGLKRPDACAVVVAMDAGAQALVHGEGDFAKAEPYCPALRFVDLSRYCG